MLNASAVVKKAVSIASEIMSMGSNNLPNCTNL
jgi:hypothetical protein